MISTALLDDLLTRMQAARLTELEVRQGEISIAMRLGTAIPVAAVSRLVQVRTHGIGTFLTCHPRRPAISVVPGDRVLKGVALGYLKAGATLTAIIAPTSGTLSEVLAKDGDLLGFGVHVFTVEESA